MDNRRHWSQTTGARRHHGHAAPVLPVSCLRAFGCPGHCEDEECEPAHGVTDRWRALASAGLYAGWGAAVRMVTVSGLESVGSCLLLGVVPRRPTAHGNRSDLIWRCAGEILHLASFALSWSCVLLLFYCGRTDRPTPATKISSQMS